MKLREAGEFGLIDQMARIFEQDGGGSAAMARARLLAGIGDDAAVWRNPPRGYTVATSDAMVEGIHFNERTTDWHDLGWKAMASNISDIAGMGALPLYALAVLGGRADQEVEDVLAMCRGMAEVARHFGTTVVGGDTVSSPLTMVTVTLVGEIGPEDPASGRPAFLSRFTARVGDAMGVTGHLGSSAGGLRLLLQGAAIPERLAPLVQAHRRPLPRVEEGRLMVKAGVRCGMDLSDGLVGDLKRICAASKVSVVVDVPSVPVDPLLTEAFPQESQDMALSGGEDYELLCIAPRDVLSRAQLLLQRAGSRLAVVGRVVEPTGDRPPVMLKGADGSEYAPRNAGWEHFTEDAEAAAG